MLYFSPEDMTSRHNLLRNPAIMFHDVSHRLLIFTRVPRDYLLKDISMEQ